ncbi:protein kinase [Streptomyces sp. NPDC058157]|uniref:serine/threonine-protein kinase n=1 Tax=Streptomyces sp. NPDC058157 TaxID=3346360 RepID=UPI0036EC830F
MPSEQANDGELVGRALGGRYRVTSVVGRGGMGVVAKAVDEVLGREVAVKLLRAYTDAAPAELADLRTRMRREAQAAARIRHTGVVTVHDVTEDQGLPVIVMELVDGPSLDAVVARRGALDPYEAAAIGAKLMDALDAAHRAGVLHRDVKPGNVLLERGGRVVLTDFGIASMQNPDDEELAKLTRSGEIVGSLDYLPPERAQGREPGPASDIWSLGMTLYAAVEGVSPFRRTSVWSTLSAIVAEPLPEARRAGPLGPVLQALMAKDPESRPTADQARTLLETVAAGAGTTAPTTHQPGPAAPGTPGVAVPVAGPALPGGTVEPGAYPLQPPAAVPPGRDGAASRPVGPGAYPGQPAAATPPGGDGAGAQPGQSGGVVPPGPGHGGGGALQPGAPVAVYPGQPAAAVPPGRDGAAAQPSQPGGVVHPGAYPGQPPVAVPPAPGGVGGGSLQPGAAGVPGPGPGGVQPSAGFGPTATAPMAVAPPPFGAGSAGGSFAGPGGPALPASGAGAPAGFGPPHPGAGGSFPQQPHTPSPYAPFPAPGVPQGGPAGSPPAAVGVPGGRGRGRARGRIVVAAAVAAVLAAGGVTYALTSGGGGGGKKARTSAVPPASAPASTAPGDPPAAASPGPSPSPTRTGPSASASKKSTASPSASGSPSAAAKPGPTPTGCAGWTHEDPKPGTYGYISGDHHLLAAPYQQCAQGSLVKSGTKLWYHCYVVNSYGNQWTFVRVDGTNQTGWLYNRDLTGQKGSSPAC